jgi:CPA1 family monovalent cation:H+ antiporter
MGWQAPRIMDADTRLQGRAVWETLLFVLNGLVFILIGLQLPRIVAELQARPLAQVATLAVAVSLAVIGSRFAWVFVTDLARLMRDRDAWREDVVLSWAGMRGVVSLAAALALPTSLPGGGPLPAREALVIVTLTVIVFTLLGQGLTLPWLIRALRLGRDAGLREEEAGARQQLLDAATRRIDQLYPVWPGHRPLLDQLRDTYRHRSEHVDRQRDSSNDGEDRELIEHREIRRTVIDSEREALLRLRAEGEVNDDVLRDLEHELDLEERRMDA